MKCIEDCFELATTDGRRPGVHWVLLPKEAVAAGQPEYVAQCPCCNCLFGVG